MEKRALNFLKFLIFTQLLGILFFTLFRVLLVLNQLPQLDTFPSHEFLLAKAFFMGFRFDLVIACYIIVLPTFMLLVSLFFPTVPKFIKYFISIYIPVIYAVALFLCASNIPYFAEFDKNLNASVFNWAGDTKFMLGMIIHEPKYYFYFFIFLLVTAAFIFVFRKVCKAFLFSSEDLEIKHYKLSTTILIGFAGLFLSGLCILGIRGRVSKKSPIRVGTAFFSNYAFPNQIGLNPVFVFMRSSFDMMNEANSDLNLISDEKALSIVKKEFNICDSTKYNSPIARYIESTGEPTRANVVIVLMEGMSAHYMQRFGYPKPITPFLDSLSNNSLFFTNFYSNGIHTMNGLYASLWGYPSLMRKHPLDQVEIPPYMGLPNTLKEKGYYTAYFSTHDEQFDNVGGFFASNGFDKIVCQKDYPSDKVVSALGVPDDYMFDYSYAQLEQYNASGKPFLAVYLTASNHSPIVVPDYFKPHFTDKKEQIIEYSDWALKNFLKISSKKPWFDNTIFIFLADHGNYVDGNVYDMPYTYNHIPFMVYSKKYIKNGICENLSSQLDVFPIVMGLLNESYINNTFGQNTLIVNPEFVSFSADDKIGCINDSVFSIDRLTINQSLYKYRVKSTDDFATSDSALATRMSEHGRAYIQAAQFIIKEKKTFVK